MPSTAERDIAYWSTQLRLLAGWKVGWSTDMSYAGKCFTSSAPVRKATIYPYGMGRRPGNYILHELLHVCVKELQRGNAKQRLEKEEVFVQDVCQIVLPPFMPGHLRRTVKAMASDDSLAGNQEGDNG